jgi:hypothetical protein
MALKSVKSMGKISNSSIVIISDNEYSCLHCGSHFTFQYQWLYVKTKIECVLRI